MTNQNKPDKSWVKYTFKELNRLCLTYTYTPLDSHFIYRHKIHISKVPSKPLWMKSAWEPTNDRNWCAGGVSMSQILINPLFWWFEGYPKIARAQNYKLNVNLYHLESNYPFCKILQKIEYLFFMLGSECCIPEPEAESVQPLNDLVMSKKWPKKTP